jgi:tyrosine-protein phosphatase YwqE
MFRKIVVDIHSHLLPCLDDGVKNLLDSIEIIKMMCDLGYKKLIITPHNQLDWFNNPPEKIMEALNKLNIAISVHRINIILQAASEYYLDKAFIKSLKNKELLTFGKNYVLIELSPFILSKSFYSDLDEVFQQGYTPVLAHPERYIYFYHQKEHYHHLAEMGVKLQLNLVSLSEHVSKELRSAAEYLVENNLVSFCGSDSHSMKNPLIIKSLADNAFFVTLVNSDNLLNSTLL